MFVIMSKKRKINTANTSTKAMLQLLIREQNNLSSKVKSIHFDLLDLKKQSFKNSTDIAFGKGVGKVVLVLTGMLTFLFALFKGYTGQN